MAYCAPWTGRSANHRPGGRRRLRARPSPPTPRDTGRLGEPPNEPQADDVPGLWAWGTTARSAGNEDGELDLETRPAAARRPATLRALLMAKAGRPPGGIAPAPPPDPVTRHPRAEPVAWRVGALRRSAGSTRQRRSPLTGRVPADMAPGEPRRILTVGVIVHLRDRRAACARCADGPAGRWRGLVPAPAPRAPPPCGTGALAHPADRRRRTRADRRAAPAGRAGDRDRRGGRRGRRRTRRTCSCRKRADGDHGARRRGLVRFGGAPGLVDSAAFGGRRLRHVRGPRSGGLRLHVRAGRAASWAGRTAALAAGDRGKRESRATSARARAGQLVATVIARQPLPRGTWIRAVRRRAAARITAPRGCGSDQPRIENVGDVNGDGADDLYVMRSDGCAEEVAGIVFGGRTGTIPLEAPGAGGIHLDPDEIEDRALVAGGRRERRRPRRRRLVIGSQLFDGGHATSSCWCAGGGAGPCPCGPGPGVDAGPPARLRGPWRCRSCRRPRRRRAEELVVGVADCEDRLFIPSVAHVLRGSRSLPARDHAARPGDRDHISARDSGPCPRPRWPPGATSAAGPAPDIALGFAATGPDKEGETWLLRDVTASESADTRRPGTTGPTAARRPGTGTASAPTWRCRATRPATAAPTCWWATPDEDFARPGPARGASTPTPRAGRPGPSCRMPQDRRRAGGGHGPRRRPDRLTRPGPADRLRGRRLPARTRRAATAWSATRDRTAWTAGPGTTRSERRCRAWTILRRRGNDVLLGGGARGDAMTGGPGGDRIDARDGAGDRVTAGPGDDLVRASDRAATGSTAVPAATRWSPTAATGSGAASA